jgi:hypothetical protein
MQLTDQDLATILAALRTVQEMPNRDVFETMPHFEGLPGLVAPDDDTIDELCERLNTE